MKRILERSSINRRKSSVSLEALLSIAMAVNLTLIGSKELLNWRALSRLRGLNATFLNIFALKMHGNKSFLETKVKNSERRKGHSSEKALKTFLLTKQKMPTWEIKQWKVMSQFFMKSSKTLRLQTKNVRASLQFRRVSYREQKDFFKYSTNDLTFMMVSRISLIEKLFLRLERPQPNWKNQPRHFSKSSDATTFVLMTAEKLTILAVKTIMLSLSWKRMILLLNSHWCRRTSNLSILKN